MSDDFDILSLLVDEKSKDQLIDDAINAIAASGYQSTNKPELTYQVIASEFKRWLIDNEFMDWFLSNDIKNSEVALCVSQAAFTFVYAE